MIFKPGIGLTTASSSKPFELISPVWVVTNGATVVLVATFSASQIEDGDAEVAIHPGRSILDAQPPLVHGRLRQEDFARGGIGSNHRREARRVRDVRRHAVVERIDQSGAARELRVVPVRRTDADPVVIALRNPIVPAREQ